jgi:uncharacterized protein with ParB-like and HNH nuclease domain
MTELSSQPTPLQTIYNWYRNGSLLVDRRYQRKLVWTLLEKQKLIDSILNAYPILELPHQTGQLAGWCARMN